MEKDLGKPFASGYSAEVYDWEPGTVLKLFKDFAPDEWVDYEAGVSKGAYLSGASAPRVDEIVEVNGRKGIIYEKKEGPSFLKLLISQPLKVKKLSGMMAQLHYNVHCTAPYKELPRQRDIMYYKIGKTDLDAATKKRLLDYLETLPRGNSLCHNDFHPDNIIMTPNGPGIIDWMDGSVGNPLADVARTSLMMRIGAPPSGKFLARLAINNVRKKMHSVYLSTYKKISNSKQQDIDIWEPVIAGVRLLEQHSHEGDILRTMIAKV